MELSMVPTLGSARETVMSDTGHGDRLIAGEYTLSQQRYLLGENK